MWTRAGLAGLLTAAVLVVVPVAPASALQTISWTTPPPATATLGQTVSFAWTGRADTFLGARITGCFANFPDAPNYTNTFGGNFATGNCNFTNRVVTTSPTYTIQVGFYLSSGGQMTQTWNISVQSTSPTLMNLPSGNTLNLTADTANGATVPAWNVYGYDNTYGTYAATCSPPAGSVLTAGYNGGSCSATNPGGRTTTQAITINVAKGNPTATWNPASQYSFGTLWGQAMTAAIGTSGLSGTWTYRDAGGNVVNANATIPVGTNQVTATWVPSGNTAANWSSGQVTRSINVVPAAQTVAFAAGTPTAKSYGDAPFPVTATGTSGGGQTTISAQAGSACTVGSPSGTTTATATVTITGAGSCVLLANQAATGSFSAAPTAQASVTVAKRTSTITWTPPSTITYGDTLAGVLTAAGDVPGTVAYTVDGTPVTGSTVLAAGPNQSVVATFTPATPANHTSAVATRAVTVQQAPQSVSLGALPDTTYGVAPFALDITDSGPGAVDASAVGACTVSGLQVTVTAAGDCTVTVTKAGDSNHLAGGPVSRTFHVAQATAALSWDTPAPIGYGTLLDETQLDAVLETDGAPEGTIDYALADGTPADGVGLDAGDHELTATWTPVDQGWAPATATVTVHVDKAVSHLSWTPPADVVSGTALSATQLSAQADQAGTTTYTVDDGTAPALGQVLAVGGHVLHATFTPTDTANVAGTTAQVPLTVKAVVLPPVITQDVNDQHQVDEQRVETQADLDAGQTRTFSVTCPSGYFASDGSGRVDAVDQGTGTLADVVVLESRPTSLDTWTVTMANHATGRAQGKAFADCVQARTSTVEGHSHALTFEPSQSGTTALSGPTTTTLTCAAGSSPVAPGYLLDGSAVVRRSAPSGTSSWTFVVVPSGADPATTGDFSVRCLSNVLLGSDHDHRLDLTPVTQTVTVPAGQSIEAQTSCGDLARGIVGGWSIDDGLVRAGAEPRAKVRATRLFNPTSAPLIAELSLLCLETRTVADAPVGVLAPPAAAGPAASVSSVASPASRAVTVGSRGRTTAAVHCGSGSTRCTGTVALVATRGQRVAGRTLRKDTVLATSAFSVAAGTSGTVLLRPTRSGRKVLKAQDLRRAELRIGKHVRTVQLRR
ncbi:hypothetical protein GCM10009795_061030 [Nocardioides hankookensis]